MSRLPESWKRQGDRLTAYVADVIYDRQDEPTRLTRMLGLVLEGAAVLFGAIVRLRLWLYEQRIFKNEHLGCLVVVVGNLTVGGTGKTPVVEKFARHLAQRDRKVAILSRGYKSRKEPVYRKWWRWISHAQETPPRVVSNGCEVLLNSEQAGDEPFMLARNLLDAGVVVLVDKDRVKAGRYAVRHFGADTLLLDDGFQYLPLKGRLNLVLVDKTNPFGNGRLLPRGILREPVDHLARANYVFITKSDGQPAEALRARIRDYHPGVDIIECSHQPKYLQSLNGGGQEPLDWLRGRRVAACSGIATPESFEGLLERNGARVVHRARFLDHHRFSGGEMERVFREAEEAGAEAVVTTEKDSVRLPAGMRPGLPFYFLRLEIEIMHGAADFEEAVSRVCFPRLPVGRREG